MFKRIHHINFIVRDLHAAARRFGQLLNMPPPPVEQLPQRGVAVVRFRLGETWLVLVQPLDADSVPGRYLAEHGEGFFLMSCQVDDLASSAEALVARGFDFVNPEARAGLDDWRVMDVNPDGLFGIPFQLVESQADAADTGPAPLT